MMKSIGYSLILLGFAILLTSVPADAEKYGNTEFFLAKSGIGDIYDLTIDEPSEATPVQPDGFGNLSYIESFEFHLIFEALRGRIPRG